MLEEANGDVLGSEWLAADASARVAVVFSAGAGRHGQPPPLLLSSHPSSSKYPSFAFLFTAQCSGTPSLVSGAVLRLTKCRVKLAFGRMRVAPGQVSLLPPSATNYEAISKLTHAAVSHSVSAEVVVPNGLR